MSGRRILMVLGGEWHDFDGFSVAMTPVLESAGHSVERTYDLGALTQLDPRCNIVLLYTCLGGQPRPDRRTAPGPTPAQADALAEWVRAGGGLLAAHAATVISETSPALRALIGGAFVGHPPQFAFTVYPLYKPHPITAGLDAFAVRDELYIEEYDESVDVHLIALDRGVAHPMAWSKREGQGRVAHVALGHGPDVWNLNPYQRLMLQSIAWLAG